jgi:hypothetical protein
MAHVRGKGMAGFCTHETFPSGSEAPISQPEHSIRSVRHRIRNGCLRVDFGIAVWVLMGVFTEAGDFHAQNSHHPDHARVARVD